MTEFNTTLLPIILRGLLPTDTEETAVRKHPLESGATWKNMLYKKELRRNTTAR